MDFSKLSTSDKVIGGSGIVLLLFSFLPWYKFSVGFASGTRNGWHYFLFGIIPVLLAIAIVVVVALQRFGTVDLPELPIPWSQALLGAAGLATLLILLRLVITDKVGNSAFHLNGSRSYGLYISFLAVIGLTVGCYLKMQEPSTAPEL
jgi:hypothetical protein